jgi:hypothetical protein
MRWPSCHDSRVLDHAELPGADLFDAGVADLRSGVESPAALLVSIARERLLAAGLEIPAGTVKRPSHRLYDLLEAEDPPAAHSRYNALLRRIVSFARAAEHAPPG